MKKILIILFVFSLLLVACMPPGEVGDTNSDSEGKNAVLVSTIDDIQVWKLVNGLTTCYITINARRYEAGGIWCNK